MLLRFCLAAFVIFQFPLAVVTAGDWPQILGPNRDGIAVAEQLLPQWPEAGPEVLWSTGVGEGFAGVAVRDNRVCLFHRTGDSEVVTACTADSGEELWSQSFPCRYQSGISSDSGPRCVPLMTDDRVIVFGVAGNLRCLELSSGREVWSRDTHDEFSAPGGYFGAGSSPVLYRDRLIVNVGGRENAAVVAFAATDGRTLWQNFDDSASYSSPVIAMVDGVPQAIVVTRLNVVSLNPDTGDVRFSFPFGARGPTVNGATPVVQGNRMFVSASYRVGSVLATLSANSVDTERSGESLLATQYATPIRYADVLFAVDGRQDVGSATLKCVDPVAGRVLWAEEGFEYGTLVRVQDELLFLTCGGELIRFAADPAAYRPSDRVQILNPTPDGYRLPAVSDGRLFVRDDRQLKCLRIGKPASAAAP